MHERTKGHISGEAVVINLDWDFRDDLDLGALYRDAECGQFGLVYSQNPGRRASSPYIHLDHQSAGHGRKKFRREHMIVTKLSRIKELYVFVWDVDAVSRNANGAFNAHPDSYRVSITDRSNNRFQLNQESASEGNCVLLGRLQDHRIERISQGAMLNGNEERLTELSNIVSGGEIP